MSRKTIFVFDSFSSEKPVLLGSLYVDRIRGEESYAFEYDEEWLRQKGYASTIDPEIGPFPGMQFPASKALFGVFEDSCPDRWGRMLINKRERILSDRENRKDETT